MVIEWWPRVVKNSTFSVVLPRARGNSTKRLWGRFRSLRTNWPGEVLRVWGRCFLWTERLAFVIAMLPSLGAMRLGRRSVLESLGAARYFFLLCGTGFFACGLFFCFWYLVFLPFLILGRSLRIDSTSFSDQRCSVIRPLVTDLGAGIFPALMYLLKAA